VHNFKRPTWQKDKMMKKLLALTLLFSAFATFTVAHSGGTDSQGCHIDHKTGIRHCH
jgi:hypothetical protein